MENTLVKPRFKILHGRKLERQFIAFDIETYISGPKKGMFLFGGVFDGVDYIHFTDRLKMKRFLTHEAFIGKIFVAHNVQYDINRIFLNDSRIERLFTGSRMVMAKWPVSGGAGRTKYIQYWDSLNYTFRPLADVGEMIGYEKKHIEFGNKITPEYIEYNRRDCEIVWHFITGFQQTLNGLGGNLRSTLAGCSMDVYRREYMPEQAEFWNIPQGVIHDFRSAYFGGRTEVFNMNKFDSVFYYDINSSYAYAMLGEMPLLDTWVNKPNLDYEGCTYAKVEVPESYYPPLPYRGDKVLFPVGKWSGFYYNNELRYALACGVRVEPVRGYHYKKSFPVFKDFILAMQKEKKKSNDKFEYSIFKTLMNSLYGRFAMRGGLEHFKGSNMKIIEMKSPGINVIWSGIIAARGRVNLHKLLLKSDSLYCDTDSSMTLAPQDTDKNMGGISLKKEFLQFKANNPKDYEYKEAGKPKRKIKGIPEYAFEIDRNHFQYEIPVKFKTSIRRKIPIHKWIVIDKYISNRYDKRVIERDGNTRPIQIGA